MEELSIHLATPEHSKKIWEWRNDATTRALFLNSDIVPWENHEKWFSKALNDSNRHFYVGKLGDNLAGVIRFDKLENTDQTYDVSINVAPNNRGKGVGKRLLSKALERFLQDATDANTIIAVIKKENIASTRTFLSAGFQEEESSNQMNKYVFAR